MEKAYITRNLHREKFFVLRLSYLHKLQTQVCISTREIKTVQFKNHRKAIKFKSGPQLKPPGCFLAKLGGNFVILKRIIVYAGL